MSRSSTCQTGQECGDEDMMSMQSMSSSNQWLEEKVVLFFRMWHMIFLCSGGALAVIIFLCCCFKCRIPRTKQEIEADFRRRKVTRKFRRELNKMQMEEIDIKDIRSVLDKVRDTFSRRITSKESGAEGVGRFAAFKNQLLQVFRSKDSKEKDKTEGTSNDTKAAIDDDLTNRDTDTDVSAATGV